MLMSKTNRQRRTLGKALLIAGVAASTKPVWQEPIVRSVILPAHAQMTETTAAPESPLDTEDDETADQSILDVLLDIIIPDLLSP